MSGRRVEVGYHLKLVIVRVYYIGIGRTLLPVVST